MAKKPETRFKERILRVLDTLKPHIWRVKFDGSSRGIPDIIICAGGRFVTWELKVGPNRADPLQMYRLSEVAMARGTALVVRPENFEWALHELQKIAGLEPKTIHKLEYNHGQNKRFLSSDSEPVPKQAASRSKKRGEKC